ncbi:MAG: EF-hand domain-containing protein [Vicinamibacterales bacterium]
MSNVSRVETIERDYTPKGVQFYYLYKQLAHPELSNYVEPFTLEERLMHVAQAEVQLGSRIPWLADAMTNELKHALGDMPNPEFIIDPDGRVVGRRAWSNPTALRQDLERLVGPVENPTRVSDLDLVTAPAVPTVAKGIVPRVELPGRMSTLWIEPRLEETDYPFYTKLRADVDQDFLRTGHGTLYLGFHIDPLYHMHWNNEAPPIEYEVTTPDGVHVSPRSAAFAVVAEPADADPREFLVDIRADDRSEPLDLRVTYYACDDANTFCVPVTQRYAVHLTVDPTAGRVFGARPTMRPGGRGRPRFAPAERLKRFDTDGDGRLTRAELPPQMTRLLDRFDTNGDDVIDAAELETMTERMRRRPER